MMYALIGDIGNTITKVCLIETKTFKIKKMSYFKSNNIYSKKFLYNNFRKFINKKSIYKFALFSSVVPKYQFTLKKFLEKTYKIKLREIKEKGINKIVKINIKNKIQVGSDRIANSVGAYKKFKSNCIVLDFGTATTFDVVSEKGEYLGGSIFPGVQISLEALFKNTAKLPRVDMTFPEKVIGKSTVESLRSGAVYGFSGMVETIVKQIKSELGKNAYVVATGGIIDWITNETTVIDTLDPFLTLDGLRIIYEKNK